MQSLRHPTIKAVFFDLGKVLVDFNWQTVIDKLKSDVSVSADKFNERILKHPNLYVYETGQISTDQFFQWMRDEIHYRNPIHELIQTWSDIFQPLPERIHLLPELKKHYRLGMISNTCDSHIQFLKSKYDFFHLFDRLIFSFETGCMKPDPAIYHHALFSLRVFPGESLFIDDLKENTEAAKSLGWQTIHIQPHESLDRVLHEMKLL
jgi:epoxide hydrolase-like predicted phosphatase